jgi:hypothetical protein
MGDGAPAGLGTVTPDNAQVAANAAYLALDAYKFDVPNMETTLPRGECIGNTCTLPPGQTDLPPTSIWTPKALAELIEGLGGAILATHSQSGIMGHDTARYLKAHGKLDLLKGLITIEGSCNLAQAGVTAADFVNIPYLAFIGDYTNPSPVCQASVDAINAAGGKADYIKLDEAGWWQGSYAGPFGAEYVGPFAGVSHMMMIESNPAPDGKATNLQVMDVLLKWADENVSKPEVTGCGGAKVPPGQAKKENPKLPPGQVKKI